MSGPASRPHSAHRHAHGTHGLRLSPRHRRLAYATFAAIWLTGILWLIFHYFLQRHGEFGAEPHPLEAWWLRLHGAAAFLALWLGGVIWIVHVRHGLARPKRRRSGLVLIAMFAVLAATGYLLYYASDDGVRDAVRLLHWLVGLGLAAPFLIHSLHARRARRTNEANTR
ncbi:MAG: hypothetical protein J0I77_10535 [Rudaea sp.]|uniref:DUF4405 domain-containing protein n=1 Tax=unclassified Rudaea TaxID=2627037 RepID=UPI0010F9E3FF|nr:MULTISPECIES: DUF4405 domain-containing protein [unclassified Rudaea]MBN8886148.1 hypothetical protein [Rudaea sp.]MBR0343846.1 hypothetical protein [Rudaea sp.]